MRKLFLGAVICCFLMTFLAGKDASGNLLKDGSFERFQDINDISKYKWSTTLPVKNKKYWPKDVVLEFDEKAPHSGQKALKLSSNNPMVVSVSTPDIAVKGSSGVKVSGWIKTEDVVLGDKPWYKARVGIMPYDIEGKPVEGGGQTLMQRVGSKDWTYFEKVYVTPPGTETVKLSFELKNCKGALWCDDIEVVKLDEKPLLMDIVENTKWNTSEPNVIPAPMDAVYKKNSISLKNAILDFDNECDDTIREELFKFAKENGINLEKEAGNDIAKIVVGSFSNENIIKLLKQLDLENKIKGLGKQGYLLFIGKLKNASLVIMASEGDSGRFYALQTLKQILVKENGEPLARASVVVDRPQYAVRGCVFGDLRRWYDGPPVKDEKTGRKVFKGWSYRDRSHMLKMNFVWPCVISRNYFVKPFPDEFKERLKSFLADCKKYYITPSLGVSPYRQNPSPGREKGGIIYSSEDDIKGAADNLVTLYELGFRDLYLAFDDLPPYRWLEYEEDKKRFKSIGEAHNYYIGKVYEIVKKKCPDATFRVISVAYGGAENMPDSWKKYSKEIASLPKDIEFIWTGNKSSDADYYSELCGSRPVIIWSNYFASLYEKLSHVPVFSYPYNGGDENFHKHTTGHFFLMVDMPNEDAAHISWYTAADYMWAPEKYNMKESMERAVLKAVSKDGIDIIRKYMAEIHKLQKNDGIPGTNKEEKIKNVKILHSTLTEYLNELKKCVNGDICRELERESDIYKNNLDILLQQYELKPLPINVLKTKEPPAIDGKLNDPVWQNAQALTDFFILKKNTLAKVQTHVRMAYDENNLYLAAVMDEPYPDKIKARFTERDTEVFIDDCFEIFIGSKEDLKDYYHIVINSRGTVFDDKRNIGDYTKWNGTYDIAASINKNSWQLEMAIPWSNFDFAGKGQKLFTCNFARERYADGRTYCTYAPLFGAGFHLPQWFWLLKLED